MFGISFFFFNVLTIWHVLFFFWMRLVSSESYHWTCWIADTCPLLDKCPNPDVFSDNFHCTQAISLFSFCWYYCIWWERERERERAIVRMKERKSVPSCSVCVLSNHVSHMLFKILTKITLNIVTQKLKIALDVFKIQCLNTVNF